jgi:molybdate transport system permease protein
LRLIAGLESNASNSSNAPGASSTVRLGTTELGALPPEHRQIGYMPQDYGLFPHMTVAQQLAFPVDADAASARYWLEHLGLAQLVARLPHQLSFGQRQRVALARALTRHSELLLFDEPFAALDTPRRRRLQQSLRALQREIAAVTIIVTHDPDEAALLADEVLVLEQGRVLQAGSIDAVFERPASLRVAELLGLHNVGEGSMVAPRQLRIGGGNRGDNENDSGLTIETSSAIGSGAAIPAGQQVMWRVSARAVAISPEGAHAGVVESIELRRGERYVRLNIAGVRFDIANEDARLREGTPCRIDVDAAGVSVW